MRRSPPAEPPQDSSRRRCRGAQARSDGCSGSANARSASRRRTPFASFEDALRAQEREERQKRQAEDREEVSLDPFEELDATAFDLISRRRSTAPPDRRLRDSSPMNAGVSRRTVIDAGSTCCQTISPPRAQADGRMQRVRPSGKPQQLPPRSLHVCGLGQPLSVEVEHLVGADDDRIRVSFADERGLCHREGKRRRHRAKRRRRAAAARRRARRCPPG